MADLAMVYITTDQQDNGAELRCTDHPDWWADADGTDLPSAIRRATDHFRDEHRVHVADCMCRDRQVIDQRCIPTARCPGSIVTGPSGTPAVCESAGAHAAHDLNERAASNTTKPITCPCEMYNRDIATLDTCYCGHGLGQHSAANRGRPCTDTLSQPQGGGASDA